jgi:hypothetical protein
MRKIECEPLDETFQSFLRGLKANSSNSYGSALRRWIVFTKMNGAATLEFKRADKDANLEKLVLEFKKYVVGLGKSENSANVGVAAIRGFLAANRMPLTFTHTEKKRLQEANRSTHDFLFTKDDLAKMVEQANLQEKYILLVGKSVGLRAGDFLTFTYGMFRGSHMDEEAPIALGEIATGKEHVKAYPFLDSDAVPIVKAMLERNPDAKNEDHVLPLVDEQSLTTTLQRLFENAHLQGGGKLIRFHSLRKYLIDRLSAVASESQWKQIVGKAIAETAYMSQDQLRDIYARAMPSIVINGANKNHAKIEELETNMNRLIGDLTMQLEALKQRDLERTKQINELKEQVDKLPHEELKKSVRALRERKGKAVGK